LISRQNEILPINSREKKLPFELRLIAPTLLVDFTALPAGWNFVNFSVGPFGDVTLLLSEDLNPQPETETSSRRAFVRDTARRGRDRALHLASDGTPIGSSDLPRGAEPAFAACWLSNDHWLVRLTHKYGSEDPNALVFSGEGQELAGFWMGDGDLQITSDGRLWCGYSDQGIFGGSELESGGLVCLDLTGHLLFRFNQYDTEEPQGAAGSPEIWMVGGLNVVSNDEVWMSFVTVDPLWEGAIHDRYHALARLVGYNTDRLWPWRIIMEQAPIDVPWPFAIFNDRILTLGSYDGLQGRPPTPEHPSALLYDVPLSGGGATEYLPVDSNGNWIGKFYSYGRGSRLYLTTDRGIYVVDMASMADAITS
jgi:hypothetical protein